MSPRSSFAITGSRRRTRRRQPRRRTAASGARWTTAPKTRSKRARRQPRSCRVSPAPAIRAAEPPLPGQAVIVEHSDGQSLATVTRVPSELAARRRPPEGTTAVVVRRASEDDVVQRLKQQQREQEAHRIAQLKIRERGLSM